MPKKHCQSAKTRKRKGKDLDEIVEDMKPEKAARLAKARADSPDPDIPGEGQFFCTSCDRHFVTDKVLQIHKATKAHKRKLKMLTETPYSIKEAEAAGGVGTFNYETLKKDVDMKG